MPPAKPTKGVLSAPGGFGWLVASAGILLKPVGLGAFDVFACVASLVALRELDERFPSLTDFAAFALPAFADVGHEYAAQRGFASFAAIAARPFDDGEARDWSRVVRSALGALRYHADASALSEPLWRDPERAFPLRFSRQAHELLRLVRGAGRPSAAEFLAALRALPFGKGFFTPAPVVAYLVARAAEGRSLGRVLDPVAGCGAFLVEAARAGAVELGGIELDQATRLVCFVHLLLARASARLELADCLRGPLWPLGPECGPTAGEPFDTVVAGPPFGARTAPAWSKLSNKKENPAGFAAFPLKTSAVGCFLSRIVGALAIGGRGSVVFPFGKDLAGEGPAEIAFRRGFATAVRVIEVCEVSAGLFGNATRSVLLFFDKARELGAPAPEPATGAVRFTRLADRDETAVPELVREVGRADLEANGWALAACSYAPAAGPATGLVAGPAFPLVSLEDLFAAHAGTVAASTAKPGPFPLLACGVGKTHERATADGEVLVVAFSGTGYARQSTFRAHYFAGPCAIAANAHQLVPKTAAVSLRFAFYLLNHLAEIADPDALPMNQGRLFAICVPLPRIEVQRALAADLDAAHARADLLESAAAAALDAKRHALENALYAGGRAAVLAGDTTLAAGVSAARLGDLCQILPGKPLPIAAIRSGPFPVVGGGAKPMGSHNSCNTEAGTVLVAAEGSAGWVSRYFSPVFRTSACLALEPVGSTDSPYLFHVLSALLLEDIKGIRHAAVGVPRLDKKALADMLVPLPTALEEQRALATRLDELDGAARSAEVAARSIRGDIRRTIEAMGAPDVDSRPSNEETADFDGQLADAP